MKAYRIKYKDGLYFCPSRDVRNPRGRGRIKSNLSKKGKIYTIKPQFKWYSTIYHPDDQKEWSRGVVRKTVESDWEIEEL